MPRQTVWQRGLFQLSHSRTADKFCSGMLYKPEISPNVVDTKNGLGIFGIYPESAILLPQNGFDARKVLP